MEGELVFIPTQDEEGGDAAQESYKILGSAVGSSCLFCRYMYHTSASNERQYGSQGKARHKGKENNNQLILSMNKRRAE